jgi:hypothetical protein
MSACPPVYLAGMTKISIFGILDFFIGICLLFEIYYLVLNRHPEKTLLINILPKMVKKLSLRD